MVNSESSSFGKSIRTPKDPKFYITLSSFVAGEGVNIEVCVLDLVQLISDNLSLCFYNQSEKNSDDNTK